MSDEELQGLRRAWRERGDSESEAAWLRAALRAELLAPDLVLARWWCGDPAAALAVARAPLDSPELAEWVRGLAVFELGPELEGPGVPARGWGHPLLVRASRLALGCLLRERYSALVGEGPPAALRALVASSLEAGPPYSVEAYCESYEGAPQGSLSELFGLVGALTKAQAEVLASRVVPVSRMLSSWLQVNFSVAHRSLYEPGQAAAVAVSAVALSLGEAQVQAEVGGALLSWLRERSDLRPSAEG